MKHLPFEMFHCAVFNAQFCALLEAEATVVGTPNKGAEYAL